MEQYFLELEHSQKGLIIDFYEKLSFQNPELMTSIKWNAPNFVKDGVDCVTFRLFPKDMFQIILHRGAKVKDSQDFAFEDTYKICKWAAPDRGIIDVLKSAEKEAEILDTIKRWIAHI